MNITITVPKGSTNHGNPNLICTPPNWYDYMIFYFANYFAHAATVVTTPGQGTPETFEAFTNALLIPTSGIVRALVTIWRHAGTVKNDQLRRAAKAGALCIVAKDTQDNSGDVEAQPPSIDVGPRSKLATEHTATADQEIQLEIETPLDNTSRLKAGLVSDITGCASLELGRDKPVSLAGCHNISLRSTSFVHSIHEGYQYLLTAAEVAQEVYLSGGSVQVDFSAFAEVQKSTENIGFQRAIILPQYGLMLC